MIYTKRKNLTCYNLLNDDEEVRFSELSPILMKRPSNVIYCEKYGKLHGIITMGDIERAYRAGKDSVIVNQHFTSVKPNSYMLVKQFFRDNDRINEVPVVNEANELVGDYARWEDRIIGCGLEELKVNKYAVEFFREEGVKKIAFVRPCEEFVKKQDLMQKWIDSLSQVGAQISVINREEIMDIDGLMYYILFRC